MKVSSKRLAMSQNNSALFFPQYVGEIDTRNPADYAEAMENGEMDDIDEDDVDGPMDSPVLLKRGWEDEQYNRHSPDGKVRRICRSHPEFYSFISLFRRPNTATLIQTTTVHRRPNTTIRNRV